jgi:HEAT repeat protein
VLRGLGPAAIPAWIKHLHVDRPLFQDACQALSDLGPRALPALPELMAALNDPRKTYHRPICEIIGRIGLAAEPAVPRLVDLLAEDRLARPAICLALGRIGARPEEVVPALRDCLYDQGDPETRHAAAQALGMFGPAAAEARDDLEVLSQDDPVTIVRDAAGDALRQIDPSSKAAEAMIAESADGADEGGAP